MKPSEVYAGFGYQSFTKLQFYQATHKKFYQATHNKTLSRTQIFNIDSQRANGLD
jgi:hypothetical protein